MVDNSAEPAAAAEQLAITTVEEVDWNRRGPIGTGKPAECDTRAIGRDCHGIKLALAPLANGRTQGAFEAASLQVPDARRLVVRRGDKPALGAVHGQASDVRRVFGNLDARVGLGRLGLGQRGAVGRRTGYQNGSQEKEQVEHSSRHFLPLFRLSLPSESRPV